MENASTADIRRAAMDLLARREHSGFELRQKLKKRFSGRQGAIEVQTEILEQEGLQSDARFAEAFIHARVGKGQGPVKIRGELKSRGVNEDAIMLAFEKAGVDWFDLARRVADKKFGLPLSPDIRGKAKTGRFMQQRGFNFDHISALY